MLAACPNNAEDKHNASNAKRLAAGVATGAAFGFLLDKGKMNVPLAIMDQMGMSNFSMMRFFLSASASSIISMSALESLGIKARKAPGGVDLGTGLAGPLSGYGANLLGGALLGSGMAITGMGTLAFSSFITVAGMFVGGMGVRLLPKALGF
eukprot:jgi/Pico_ML_1/51670/g244.t1